MKYLPLLLLCFITLNCKSQDLPDRKESAGSILDWRYRAFSDNSKVPLDQDWELYWNQLLTPEDFRKVKIATKPYLTPLKSWNKMSIDGRKLESFGYATYRCRVIVNSDSPLMGLYLPGIFSSAKIWINGELMREIGVVGESQQDTRHHKTDLTIPFSIKSDTVEFVIQAANFYHKNGGMIASPVLGSSQQLLAEERLHTISRMLYIGSLGFIGTSFLLLYLFYWRKDTAILYFGLFCLCWSYREMSANYAPLVNIIPAIPWSINVRLEYISLYLGALSGSLFLSKIFKAFTHDYYVKLVGYTITVFIMSALVLPSPVYTRLLVVFFAAMGINLSYIVFILIKGAIAGRRDSRLAVVSVILATVFLTLHVFTHLGNKAENMVFIYLGYLAVFLLNSMLLGGRFSKSFFKLERLQAVTLENKEEISAQTEQLIGMNAILSQKTVELKDKNEEINDINRTLEKEVSKRTSRLAAINGELDTFLYKSSHDLRRPVKSLLGLTYLADRTIVDNNARILFNKIERSARSMDVLLGKLVEINEIKDHSYTRQSIDCKALMQRLKDDVKMQVMKSDGIDFQLNHPEAILGDPVLLYKLLYELFKNSAAWVDYMEYPIVLQCEIRESTERTKITIRDNGPGIPPELINEVWSMYKVGNEKTGGNGLGLYIVNKILEKLKGEIELKNHRNTGTSVIITLPSG